MRRLTQASRALAAGRLDVRVPESQFGSPELAELAHSFNDMAERLQESLDIISADRDKLLYLTDYCVDPFVDAAQNATGRLVAIQFMNPSGDCVEPKLRADGELSFERENSILRLNGSYLFRNFVVGPDNRLAQASCMAVSESPGMPTGVSKVADRAAVSMPNSTLARSISPTLFSDMGIWEISTAFNKSCR